tara:strand:- start:186 stop:911 length:726 start_codon:yes stop_codon:yes gene_type:complete
MSIVEMLKEATPKYELTLPSTGEKKFFRPFLVKEEKILLMAKESSDELTVMRAVKDLIESCVDVQNIEHLPMFDIEYIYLQLRAKSIGEMLTPTYIFSDINEEVKLEINIDDIKIEYDKKHTNEIALTDDIIIIMKYPTISILEEIQSIKGAEEIPLFHLIIHCIDKIETKEETLNKNMLSVAELSEFVSNFTKEQYEKAVHFFATSPKLEYKTTINTQDGKEREIVLKGLLDFFKSGSAI